MNLDILPSIEDFFSSFEKEEKLDKNKKDWKDQLRQCEKYDRCDRCTSRLLEKKGEGKIEKINSFCQCHEQQCQNPDSYYYFTFHHYYPENFLTKMISTYFFSSSAAKVCDKKVVKGKYHKKLPVSSKASFGRQFIRKYIDKPFRKYYQHEVEVEEELKLFTKTDIYYRICDISSEKEVEEILSRRDELNINLYNMLWGQVVANPKISFEFLLSHLKNRTVVEVPNLVSRLSKHPSFATHWRTYLSFFRDDQITKAFGQLPLLKSGTKRKKWSQKDATNF
jgi:hypothetical protein